MLPSLSIVAGCISYLNSSVYNGTVVNNSKLYSKIYDPLLVPILPLTKTETLLHIIFISQAVPVNFFIGLVFMLDKQLRQNPRNAFWIGIIGINLLTVLIAALRLALSYGDDDQDGIVCFLFSLLNGKPYTILLVIHHLAALYRCYLEPYPEFSPQNSTTRRIVVFVQIYLVMTVFFAMSLPQVAGPAAFRCGFSLKMVECNIMLRSIYVVLGVIQVIIFHWTTRINVWEKRKTLLAMKMKSARQLSKNNAVNNNRPTAALPLPSKTDDDKEDQKEVPVEIDIPTAVVDHNSNQEYNEDEEDKKINRELVEANAKLLTDYVNLLLIISPMLFFYFYGSYNNHICQDSSEITTTVPSMGLCYFVYAVYGPLIFCFVSKDFSKAVNRIFSRKAAADVAPKKTKMEICLIHSDCV